MARRSVPKDTQGEVLAACRRRCAICFGLNRDTAIKTGQIAHLDRDAANPSLDNLVFLCLEHHDQFDSKTSQSKGLSSEEVRRFRQELIGMFEPWERPATLAQVGAPAEGGSQPKRAAIREESAAEIFDNLGKLPQPYLFYESVKDLYLGRWTRESGWQVIVHSLPNARSGGGWSCMFSEVGSGHIVGVHTAQDLSALRLGDSVSVTGRISDVSPLKSVILDDAIVRGENVTLP